jgi:uncharacterized membrane protein YphA (DoxX/SURF4 family)
MSLGRKGDWMLARISIALVWFYQGLWCKVLSGSPRHLSIVSAVPLIGPSAGHVVLVALGFIECGLGVWVLTGRQRRNVAVVQTALLAGMNAAALVWCRQSLPDPLGMILQNFAFVVLIWTVTEVPPHVANA